MIPKAVIVDYGIGNLFGLKCALEKVGFNVAIAFSPRELKKADAIIMPGVGNFFAASQRLAPIRLKVIELINETPTLGICLGMQLFFHESEEEKGEGLSLIQGKVVRLPSTVKIPHMGWNTLRIIQQNPLFEGVPDQSFVYFAHSYYPTSVDRDVIIAETSYGVTFASAIAKRTIYGTQFHPEKSGEIGLTILRNFAKVVRR